MRCVINLAALGLLTLTLILSGCGTATSEGGTAEGLVDAAVSAPSEEREKRAPHHLERQQAPGLLTPLRGKNKTPARPKTPQAALKTPRGAERTHPRALTQRTTPLAPPVNQAMTVTRGSVPSTWARACAPRPVTTSAHKAGPVSP